MWNGTTWRVQSTPNPTGAKYAYLNAVSCSASNACEAVGDYSTKANYLTLAEVWNGTTWRIQRSINRPGKNESSVLGGISCTARNACEAIGSYFNTNTYSDGSSLAEQRSHDSAAHRELQNVRRAAAPAAGSCSIHQ